MLINYIGIIGYDTNKRIENFRFETRKHSIVYTGGMNMSNISSFQMFYDMMTKGKQKDENKEPLTEKEFWELMRTTSENEINLDEMPEDFQKKYKEIHNSEIQTKLLWEIANRYKDELSDEERKILFGDD